jgi:hypothetical protein
MLLESILSLQYAQRFIDESQAAQVTLLESAFWCPAPGGFYPAGSGRDGRLRRPPWLPRLAAASQAGLHEMCQAHGATKGHHKLSTAPFVGCRRGRWEPPLSVCCWR